MRLLIVGAGQMGGYYLDILVKKLGFSVEDIAVSDIDRGKAQALSQRYGVEMVDHIWTGFDAAIVAVSTPAHARVIATLRGCGVRHILCEKPLGFTVKDVESIGRAQGDAEIYTALVINFSPALGYLQQLMEREDVRPLELYGYWGKFRPLDKNVRPSAGDVEDESVHPIAFALALIPGRIRRVSVAAHVGRLPFVDPLVQKDAHDSDPSFPMRPNHATSAWMQVATDHGEIPIDVRSSFLLVRQTRQVGGVLGQPGQPTCAFQVDFDQQGADVLAISSRGGMREERFTADKLRDVTAAFIAAANGGPIDPRLADVEEAGLLVRVTNKILQSNTHKGEKVWLNL